MAISTTGTIKQRHQTAIANNPAYDISATVQHDSYVLASGAADGFALVKDSAQGDGWGVGFAKLAGPTAPRTYTLPDHDATLLTDQALVTLAQGGTGPFGAAGTVLVGGATPAWSASPTLTSVTLTGNMAAGAAGLIGWTGRAQMESVADGVIYLHNAAATDFGRMMFGGTTSSFPALQRNSTQIDVVFADASGLAFLRAATLTAGTSVVTPLVNSTGDLSFTANSPSVGFKIRAADGHLQPLNSGTDIGVGQTFRNVFMSGALVVGTNPATAGAIRLANAVGQFWRNAGNTNDLVGISYNSSDQLQLGNDSNAASVLIAYGTIPVILNTTGLLKFGGTTNSFSALKRDTVFLSLRLADDSGVSGAATLSLPVGASGRDGNIGFDTTLNAFVYYVGGNRYKVVGVAF